MRYESFSVPPVMESYGTMVIILYIVSLWLAFNFCYSINYNRTVSEQNCDLHEAVDIKAPQSPFVPYKPLPSLDVHPGSHLHTPVVLSHVPWLLHSTSSVVPGCEVTNVNPAPVPVKEPAAIARLGTFPCSVLKVTLIAK